MNRLCIYMTYNREQKIYEYMGSVLKALRECCSKVYLICNYERINAGIENAIPFIDQIIYRKNLGFDAGAYKDILCNMLGWDEVRRGGAGAAGRAGGPWEIAERDKNWNRKLYKIGEKRD